MYRILQAEGAQGPGPTEIRTLAAQRNVPIKPVARDVLDTLADHHQGLVAEAEPFRYVEFEQLLGIATSRPTEQPALLLAVDALQDPQNFGSLLRTMLAVGGLGVVLPERRSVHITPAVGRASAGTVEHLRIARVVNLVRALRQLQREGIWVAGLDSGGRALYDEVDLTVPLALVVGSEGAGLSRLVAETCDLTLRLPMEGPVESLNASVAGSIVLYEVLRQRRRAP